MSIVVAIRKDGRTVMASDSQSNYDQHRELAPNQVVRKLLKLGNTWLGATGWGLYENILRNYVSSRKSFRLGNEDQLFTFFQGFWRALHERYSYVNDQGDKDDKSPFADLDASFLLANRNGIFQVSSDMSVGRFEQFQAIGSGADYATGAMHALYGQPGATAESIARQAVETAIRFNIYCGGEVQLIQLKSSR